ncbi:MAG: tyrosine-type recombinase/integrase [Deltaproteobacteria bacterium]|nr:tyrosine-type recombinase/integrase [Deltaproteobacteria bacterium]
MPEGEKAIRQFERHMRLEASPNTVHVYGWALRKAREIAHRNLLDLKPVEIDEIRAKTREMLSPKSASLIDVALRCFYRWAARAYAKPELLDLASFRSKKPPTAPRTGPSPAEMERLIGACRTPDERALLLTLYSTGCRIGELVGNKLKGTQGLTVDQIDWKEGSILIEGKGGAIETAYFIHYAEEAMQALRSYIGMHKKKRVFPFGYQYARSLLKRIGERVGIKLTPHALRHAAATNMIRGGIPIAVVRAALRHRSMDSTLVYVNLNAEDFRRARQILAQK